MFCSKCGKQLNDNENFCSFCGSKVNSDNILKSKSSNNIDKAEEENISKEKNIKIIKESSTLAPFVEKFAKKIKSGAWNAFVLEQEDFNEYINAGLNEKGGIFYEFSKEKKEIDKIKTERMTKLIVQSSRFGGYSEEKFKEYNRLYTNPPSKPIISLIVESKKNIFDKELSFKKIDENELRGLIDEGKKISGKLIASYPIIETTRNGLLFVTSEGIGFVTVPEGTYSSVFPVAVAQALGPIGFLAAHVMKDLWGRMNKGQRKIFELTEKYSIPLVAKCFASSQFVPYGGINILIGDKRKIKNATTITFIYNNNKSYHFELAKNDMEDIMNILSMPILPK